MKANVRGITTALALVLMAVTATLFQNCQKANLSGAGGGSAASAEPSGQLTAVVSQDPEDAQGTINQTADSGTSSSGVTTAGCDSPGKSGKCPPGISGTPENPGTSSETPDDTGDDVCILDGPGKSVKLGMTEQGTPQGQNPVPDVLCMSANACLNIASKAFKVQGPEFRGYCKANGNPHVTHITDAQLMVKVMALLAKP